MRKNRIYSRLCILLIALLMIPLTLPAVPAMAQPVTYALTININGTGVTNPTGTTPQTVDAVIPISATPGTGNMFTGWQGPVANPGTANTTVTMSGTITLTAMFAPAGPPPGPTFTFSIANDGNGNTNPPTGAYPVPQPGTIMGISATPGPGYAFNQWTGDIGTIASPSSANTSINISGTMSITATFAPAGPPPPIVYYQFNSGTGTTAVDTSPNGYDGTLTDGTSWSTLALAGTGAAVQFDGTDDWVNAGNETGYNLSTTDHTIEFWFRSGTLPAQAGHMVSRHTGGTPGEGFWIAMTSTNGNILVSARSTGDYIDLNSGTNSCNNKWHHAAYVVDTQGKNAFLYIDGTQLDSDTYTGDLIDHNDYLGIGASADAEPYHYPWEGIIDEFRIWGFAMSAQDVTDALVGHDPMLSAGHNPTISDQHDPTFSESHDPAVSGEDHDPFMSSQGHDPYISEAGEHDLLTSWMHDPVSSDIHDGIVSTIHTATDSAGYHDTAMSLNHDAFFSTNHVPSTSAVHDGSYSEYHTADVSDSGHDPSISTGHDPYLSDNHDPASSDVHDGMFTNYHTQTISEGDHSPDISLGHDAFFSANHDPSTSDVHDGAFTNWHSATISDSDHDPNTSIGGHDPMASTGHDPYLSDNHDPATSSVHDGLFSDYHTQTLSEGDHSPDISLGHDAFFSANHDPATSDVHDGAFANWHSATVSDSDHDPDTSIGGHDP
ncbi:MAG: hypothetical protein HQ553_13240, partial [Chloroflexi bacterium]|nr:hypothetical protein [Chloroflexota bacterium]